MNFTRLMARLCPVGGRLHLWAYLAYCRGRAWRARVNHWVRLRRRNWSARWQRPTAPQRVSGLTKENSRPGRFDGRKRVLVIDEKLPLAEGSAGERSLLQMMEAWLEAGVNVKFIPADFKRRPEAEAVLAARGVEIIGLGGGNFFEAHDFLLDYGFRLDAVMVCRPYVGLKFRPLLGYCSRARLIYNCVDLHYLRLGRGRALAERAVKVLERTEMKMADAADVTLTFSLAEKEILARRLTRAEVRVGPIFSYGRWPEPGPDFASRAGLIFVGGFEHQPNVDAMRWFALEILPLVRQACPGLELNIVGRDPAGALAGLSNCPGVIRHGFVSDEKLAALYRSCRLAVVPLRYGAGVKGKLVEALAHGLPVVATSMALEGLEGIGDFIPGDDGVESIAARIQALYDDPPTLAEAARRNREYAEQKFSARAAADFYWRLIAE